MQPFYSLQPYYSFSPLQFTTIRLQFISPLSQNQPLQPIFGLSSAFRCSNACSWHAHTSRAAPWKVWRRCTSQHRSAPGLVGDFNGKNVIYWENHWKNHRKIEWENPGKIHLSDPPYVKNGDFSNWKSLGMFEKSVLKSWNKINLLSGHQTWQWNILADKWDINGIFHVINGGFVEIFMGI